MINEPLWERKTRIDAYIDKSADFAKPILRHIRKLVHAACPDAEETMKWSFPQERYICSGRHRRTAMGKNERRPAEPKRRDDPGHTARTRPSRQFTKSCPPTSLKRRARLGF